ncbi:MAG TPA: aldo/keto reductase [Caulobacteraceae bacterium]|jgi:aryl-alcohol dehydrogenase-like predicted oxidoreductase
MKYATLGALGDVSRLTLGGGGIGQIWGETSREEAVATIDAALDGGITVLDAAPGYRNCETFIGEHFGGQLPAGVKVTTKHALGTVARGEAEARLTTSLGASLAAMRLPRVDVFFLHTNICADDYVYAFGADRQDAVATRWTQYAEEVVPAMEALKAAGRIGAWGITGIGVPDAVTAALRGQPKPQVVQAIANLLDSPGALNRYGGPARPRDVIAAAKAEGVGVMGIRAVQAGALTRAIDRTLSPNSPDTKDYDRAAPFRALCEAWGEDPAMVAHRYALGIPGVDTLVLGVKNRAELQQCLDAEAAGPLEAAQLAAIEGLGLR